MSVTEVTLDLEGLSGTLTGLTRDQASVELESRYNVWVDSALDTTYAVLLHFYNTPSLPSPGRSYRAGNDVDSIAYCDRLTCQGTKSDKLFKVTAHFANIGADDKGSKNRRHSSRGDKNQQTDNPQDFRTDCRIIWQSVDDYDKPLIYEGGIDTDQQILTVGQPGPCINSALDPLLSRPPWRRRIRVIDLARYDAVYPTLWDDELFKANDAGGISFQKPNYGLAFQIDSKGQLLLNHFGADLELVNGRPWWKVTCQLLHDPSEHGHLSQVLDCGYRGRAATNTRNFNKVNFPNFAASDEAVASGVYNIFDKPTTTGEGGTSVSTPRLLNGKGEPEPNVKPRFLMYRGFEYSSRLQEIVDYFLN